MWLLRKAHLLAIQTENIARMGYAGLATQHYGIDRGKMIIACDLDGVIFDFTTAYADLLIQVSGEDRLPKGWRISPDFPPVWYWERAVGYSPEVEREVWTEHILKKGKEFWLKLGLLPDAQEVILRLNDLTRQGHDVYFITHRMGWHAKAQTEKALYNWGMCYPTVLMSPNKTPILRSLDAGFFVDDKLETMVELVQTAEREGWVGERHFYLKDAPYNREGRPVGMKVVGGVKEAMEKAGLW